MGESITDEHKAGRAALGLSCGARFELPNGVYFGSGAFQSGSFDSLRSLRMTDMKHIEKGWGWMASNLTNYVTAF